MFLESSIKRPFDAQRIAFRELMPLMQSGAREWITAETRFGATQQSNDI
jgi:hypothetical protein